MASGSNNSNKSAVPFHSLSEILSRPKPVTRSSINTTLLPSLEDLQKKLDGKNEEPSSSKLNFSRAFGLGSSFDFEHKSITNHEDTKINNSLQQPINNQTKLDSGQLKPHIKKPAPRTSRDSSRNALKRDLEMVIKKEPIDSLTISDSSQREIIHIIKQIERNRHFNFGDEDDNTKVVINQKPEESKPPSGFNMIQLPKDFRLEHGQLNVYKSGRIEIVSGDNPPIIYNLKRVPNSKQNDYLTADLVITTDSQVYVDRMNVLISETMNQLKLK